MLQPLPSPARDCSSGLPLPVRMAHGERRRVEAEEPTRRNQRHPRASGRAREVQAEPEVREQPSVSEDLRWGSDSMSPTVASFMCRRCERVILGRPQVALKNVKETEDGWEEFIEGYLCDRCGVASLHGLC